MSETGEGAGIVTAALLVIGDEILSGRTKDKNIGHIADHLTAIGIQLKEVRIVSDDEPEIVDAVNALRKRYDYVFTTGGIGPTHDDITADAIAKAFGVGIDVDERALAPMKAYFERRGVELTPARLRMARIPGGADLIAPALWDGSLVLAGSGQDLSRGGHHDVARGLVKKANHRWVQKQPVDGRQRPARVGHRIRVGRAPAVSGRAVVSAGTLVESAAGGGFRSGMTRPSTARLATPLMLMTPRIATAYRAPGTSGSRSRITTPSKSGGRVLSGPSSTGRCGRLRFRRRASISRSESARATESARTRARLSASCRASRALSLMAVSTGARARKRES